jgi:hypothetical protein
MGAFESMVIDDPGDALMASGTGARWQLITDRVMGGVSRGTMVREAVGGRMAIHLRGAVSVENNGGFIQIARDLTPDLARLDASAFDGVEIDVCGNGERYAVHLRTDAIELPWQSYRQGFLAPPCWLRVRLPFADFEPHRISVPLDVRGLRRIGIVAIGRAFTADLALARVALYRAA